MSEAAKPQWTFEMEGHRDRIYDPDGHTFAEWGTESEEEDQGTETARDQARKMVQAMNMHDGLAKVCRELASIQGKIPDFPGSVFLVCARDLARATVAALESALAGEPTG